MNLPKLTKQQSEFVIHYGAKPFAPKEAYKNSYNCENMSEESIAVEVSRLLKHPKVSLWIKYIDENAQKVAKDELNYSIKDCFDELDDVRLRAKKDNGNYNQELKAIELKGKLAGHFVDKHEVKTDSLADVLDRLK